MNKGLVILLLMCFRLPGQTFEIDQLEQLFRPRIRTDFKYNFDSRFSDTSSLFNQKEAAVAFTFPIKTKLNAELNLDLNSLRIKDLLKNSIRIKASQTLGMFRVNMRQSYLGFDSLPSKNIMNATAGILGVRLTRKYRVMFYSANISIAEQDLTIKYTVPRFSGLIGQLHPRGLKRNFFYGAAAAYSDGLIVPLLFFGGSEPIGKKFIFNYTLPVQINIQYKDDKRTLITAGISADGFRSGILYRNQRLNLNYASVVTYASLRYKLSRVLVGRIECGYAVYQNIRYAQITDYRYNFRLEPGPYVQAGFNVLFGQTLWEKLAEGILKN